MKGDEQIVPTIDLEACKKNFSSVIWNRGRSYYREGRVRSISGEFPRFMAEVRGSGRKIYNVYITLTEDGNILNEQCSCPYPDLCKHEAAVLMELDDQMPYVHGDQTDRSEMETDKHYNVREKVLSETERFYSAESLQVEIDAKKYATNRFKLGFTVLKKEGYAIEDRLFVEPCLIYIKKDGTDGRIDKFRLSNLTEYPEGAELDLLLFYLNKGQKKLDLASNFELISRLKDIFLEQKKAVLQMSPLEKVEINFTPSNELLKDDFFVHPNFSFYGSQTDSLKILRKDIRMQVEHQLWLCLIPNGVLYFERDYHKVLILSLLQRWGYTLSYSSILAWRKNWQVEGLSFVQVHWPKTSFKIIEENPRWILDMSQAMGIVLIAVPKVAYGEKEFLIQRQTDIIAWIEETDQSYIIHQRNLKAEGIFSSWLVERLGDDMSSYFGWDSNESHLRFKFWIDLDDFLFQYLEILNENDVTVRLHNKKLDFHSKPRPLRISLATSQADWFQFRVHMDDNNHEELDLSFLEKGIVRQGDSFYKITPKDLKKLKALQEEGLDESGNVKVHSKNFAALKEIQKNLTTQKTPIQYVLKVYTKLLSKDKLPMVEVDTRFKAELRPYQQEGLNWLNFLYSHQFNACLADDMGLGKTVQMLALLSLVEKNFTDQNRRPFLIVAPVTTLPNWESEIKRFAPYLSVLRHHGAGRDKENLGKEFFQIILTSYHTLRNDLDYFLKIEFDTIVLDESQIIKNPQSKAFKAVRQLSSLHRFSMTGTPVENRTLELWSQFDFLAHGLLGDRKSFVRRFARSIEERGDTKQARKLKMLTQPFLLRRKKEDVLQDLPDKEEVILRCEMEGKQRKLYEQTAGALLNRVKTAFETKGKKKSAITIFDALLKLRQICLFPGLVDEKHEKIASIKLQVLRDLIQDGVQEKHKILIFSQFVKVLDRIEPVLEELGIKFVRLDGSTRNREKPVRQFQEDPETLIFLVSLKAGNTGINLTAADYVVLFDPWWNPAVESQAVDRAHRIGQTRKVFSYRLVVEDSVEEKILALQERKRELVDNLITADKTVISNMDEETILNLFE